jgi:uncharacterized protein YnzC (UPF0291/DUF896 family)
MEQTKLDRINVLARKAKTEGLTAAERAEQAALRTEYVAEYRNMLRGILDHTTVVRPDGTREPLRRKEDASSGKTEKNT